MAHFFVATLQWLMLGGEACSVRCQAMQGKLWLDGSSDLYLVFRLLTLLIPPYGVDLLWRRSPLRCAPPTMHR